MLSATRNNRGTEQAITTPLSGLAASHSKGFTLLEVMVAVAIMAMVLVTLLGLQSRTMQDVTLVEHITTATLLAKRMMTDTIMVKPRIPFEDKGEFTEAEFKGYTWKKAIIETPLRDIMEVRVTVFWDEGTRQESVELVGYE